MKNVKIEDGIIVLPEGQNAIELFSDDAMKNIVSKIKHEVKAHVPDLESTKGRKAIASLSAKVSKSKVVLDNLGKGLVADQKKKIALVDNVRKSMRDDLDNLRDEARKPLTEWEEEQERLAEEEQARIELERSHSEALQDDELFVLRKEKAEREEKERIEREAAEQKEREAQAEKERVENEERIRKEEAERVRREAEKQLEDERERTANAERERIASEERAKIQQQQAVEKATREERERSERIERERIEKEAEAERAAKKVKAAEEKKALDKKHRAKINNGAVDSLVAVLPKNISLNASESNTLAKSIIESIARNRIPNITINY